MVLLRLTIKLRGNKAAPAMTKSIQRENSQAAPERPTPAELMERATAIVPALQLRAAETEQKRRISDRTMKELHAAGLFKILQPRSFHGFEYGLDTFVEIVMEIGRGCLSTSWVYAVMAQHQWMIGMFPPQAQQDVWENDTAAIAASSFTPNGHLQPTAGGFLLSGVWTFASGCDHAQWFILGAKIPQEPDPDKFEQGFVLVPRSIVTIEDNWNVIGLAGTGSKKIVINESFVPGHRSLTVAEAASGTPPGARINHGPLFKIPFPAAISNCITTPAIGNAQGALEEYIEALTEKRTQGAITGAGNKIAELPTIQLRVAEAAAAIDAARLLVIRGCRDTMAGVEGNRTLSTEIRVRNRRDHAFAVRLATQAVDRLFESAGGRALQTGDSLQRRWRDAHAAAMHISTNWDAVGTMYGRFALGLNPEGAHY